MLKRSRKKRPTDVNVLAATIVAEATQRGTAETATWEKNPAAVALGRLGGLKGGKARAKKLTPRQRSRIASRAAQVRWKSAGK